MLAGRRERQSPLLLSALSSVAPPTPGLVITPPTPTPLM